MLKKIIDWFKKIKSKYEIKPPAKDVITLENNFLYVKRAKGEDERLDLKKVIRIEIITTDEGPYHDDVFWVFDAGEKIL